MAKGNCSVSGCERDVYVRALCSTHYHRAKSRGEIRRRTPEERFFAKVEKTATCWNWTAHLNEDGYSKFRMGDKHKFGHRVSYEWFVGPIPEGLTIDHLCRNRKCVNPEHLEAVTHKVNVLRGTAPSALHAVKTHCPRGHAYDEANTFWNRDGTRRGCRQCRRDRHLDRYVPHPPTHCRRGHEYTPKNTGRNPKDGSRKCRACANARARARTRRIRAEQLAANDLG